MNESDYNLSKCVEIFVLCTIIFLCSVFGTLFLSHCITSIVCHWYKDTMVLLQSNTLCALLMSVYMPSLGLEVITLV